MTYKDIICVGYCKNYRVNKEVCIMCGDFCKKFEQSEFANYMVGEELMEQVSVIYEKYLQEQVEVFKKENMNHEEK